MQGQLLRTLDDDVLASVVPANHVVILWPLEEAGCMHGKKVVRMWRGGREGKKNVQVLLGEEGGEAVTEKPRGSSDDMVDGAQRAWHVHTLDG